MQDEMHMYGIDIDGPMPDAEETVFGYHRQQTH